MHLGHNTTSRILSAQKTTSLLPLRNRKCGKSRVSLSAHESEVVHFRCTELANSAYCITSDECFFLHRKEYCVFVFISCDYYLQCCSTLLHICIMRKRVEGKKTSLIRHLQVRGGPDVEPSKRA